MSFQFPPPPPVQIEVDDEENSFCCAICQNSLVTEDAEEPLVTTSKICGHKFHFICLHRYAIHLAGFTPRTFLSCPLCRAEIPMTIEGVPMGRFIESEMRAEIFKKMALDTMCQRIFTPADQALFPNLNLGILPHLNDSPEPEVEWTPPPLESLAESLAESVYTALFVSPLPAQATPPHRRGRTRRGSLRRERERRRQQSRDDRVVQDSAGE